MLYKIRLVNKILVERVNGVPMQYENTQYWVELRNCMVRWQVKVCTCIRVYASFWSPRLLLTVLLKYSIVDNTEIARQYPLLIAMAVWLPSSSSSLSYGDRVTGSSPSMMMCLGVWSAVTVTQMELDHRLAALLQQHLHSRLYAWLQ